jgi:hypothetical protein
VTLRRTSGVLARSGLASWPSTVCTGCRGARAVQDAGSKAKSTHVRATTIASGQERSLSGVFSEPMAGVDPRRWSRSMTIVAAGWGRAMASEELCIHDLVAASCSTCKPSRFPKTVWVSGGGQSFHRSRSCPALRRGQDRVERWGGEVADVRSVSRNEAFAKGYQPCERCFSQTTVDETSVWRNPTEARAPQRDPATVFVCLEEYGYDTRARRACFHRSARCEQLLARRAAVGGRVVRVDTSAARRRRMQPCTECLQPLASRSPGTATNRRS